ncbi:MAG TPA: DUF488 domain-containing protein [Aeromicrobium sp.]|nr:DUF488 domain-containing protein [Aeromicrobium sp.]
MSQPIYTIGHSTRPIEEFLSLLQAQAIGQLVDIRTVPRSRHNPQYEQDALAASLADAGITYAYLKALGGLRPKAAVSTNTAWRNQSFRNYADHMQTDEFRQGLAELLDLSAAAPTAIMCAEAVPWRCHRSLVADALLARGIPVLDIINPGAPASHKLTSFAIVTGVDVTYAGPAD